ncbi:PKD-like domain-containing protein [Porphyromonas sp.]|uniref:PKD-like domain-containing protein n=1 Tax=Porphyromonas sp. TaxID=1924944 RepID=UPI0026DC5AD2|nr:PKD-like domain-containing protein [Porphyromonas sp.]MDO4770887.1 PKD-like domain-containing protein [Porphyromonas sp.]
MKKNLSIFSIILSCLLFAGLMTSCDNDNPYQLKKDDIKIEVPDGGFVIQVDQLLKIKVSGISDEGLAYEWFIDGESISRTKDLEHFFESAGEYKLTLKVTQGKKIFEYPITVKVIIGGVSPTPKPEATAYITKVLDYMPGVGQFVNKLPKYDPGDTQEKMNEKVLASIGNNARGLITLGGFGGYVVVGFDHTIQNIEGKRDFRVLGNAFYATGNPDPDAPEGGSCEPGVIMVAYDVNKNGLPDDNEWYEIEGSAHADVTKEPWYEKAKKAGNNVHLYRDCEITYHKPKQEPETSEEKEKYVRWEDNKGNSGFKVKNPYHNQPYFPLWVKGDKLVLKGTCLPQNGINESEGSTPYFVLYKFRYGYADNELNTKDDSAIDISWAVNERGQKVHLPGVDFIKVYTGVNQENGWLGECSTEIMGIEDLHILGK